MEESMSQRQAVTKQLATTCWRKSLAEKARSLDQLVELTGWHQDHARACLREAETLRVVRPRLRESAKGTKVPAGSDSHARQLLAPHASPRQQVSDPDIENPGAVATR